jgi:hypothetical protein
MVKVSFHHKSDLADRDRRFRKFGKFCTATTETLDPAQVDRLNEHDSCKQVASRSYIIIQYGLSDHQTLELAVQE